MPIQRAAEKTNEKDVYKIALSGEAGREPLRCELLSAAHRYPREQDPAWRGSDAPGDAAPRSRWRARACESLGQEPQTKAHIYGAGDADYTVKITGTGSLRNAEAAPADAEDTGQPQIEEKAARVYSRMYWVLGLAFAILGLGGVLLYRRSAA